MICNLEIAEMFYAVAETQSGNATALESGAKEGEVLANASRRLATRPPPLETTPCAFLLG